MNFRKVVGVFLFSLVLLLNKGCSTKSENKENPAGPEVGVFETGVASWYGDEFQGKRTASGEIFDINKLTAAHKSLTFGTQVEITNKANGRTVTVKINDRGPYVKDRIIDVSKRTAIELGMLESGLAEVSLKILQAE